MKSYNIERTTWFSFLVVIGAFFAMYRPTLQAQKEQEEKVEIRQKLQPAMENIQKQEQSSREAVQSQMKDLLRTPSSAQKQRQQVGNDQDCLLLTNHREITVLSVIFLSSLLPRINP